MNTFIEQHKDFWGDDPSSLMEEYNYHPELTEELDSLTPDFLNKEQIYKIVLWKLNRFPYISNELMYMLKGVATIKPKKHKEAESMIRELLKTSGIALPMASTILRFINPNAFQIIDDRAYRVLLPGEPKYPSKPQKSISTYVEKSIDIYFKYLDRIHEISNENLPFSQADRILYQLDIKLGNKIGSTA